MFISTQSPGGSKQLAIPREAAKIERTIIPVPGIPIPGAGVAGRELKRTSCKRRKFRTFLVAAIGTFAFRAIAGEPGAVATQLVAEVRESLTTAPGRETFRLVPATTLAQGQVVFYTVRIHNPAPIHARDVTVTQRIPDNTAYIADSAAGPGAEISFSLDGGQTFAGPDQLTTADAAGAARLASAEQYTHIRWRLRNALAPGAVALARFRAVFR